MSPTTLEPHGAPPHNLRHQTNHPYGAVISAHHRSRIGIERRSGPALLDDPRLRSGTLGIVLTVQRSLGGLTDVFDPPCEAMEGQKLGCRLGEEVSA